MQAAEKRCKDKPSLIRFLFLSERLCVDSLDFDSRVCSILPLSEQIARVAQVCLPLNGEKGGYWKTFWFVAPLFLQLGKAVCVCARGFSTVRGSIISDATSERLEAWKSCYPFGGEKNLVRMFILCSSHSSFCEANGNTHAE